MRRIGVFFCFSALVLAQKPQGPAHVFSYAEPLTAARSGAPKEIALDHLRSVAGNYGLNAKDLDTLYVAREYKSNHNGVTHLLFRQKIRDVEVRNAAWTVNIDRDGRVINAGGKLFSIPSESLAAPTPAQAVRAVRSAAEAVNPELAQRFLPITTGATGKNLRFSKGNFGEDIAGKPVWFAVKGVLHAAWQFNIVEPNGIDSYSVIVDGPSGRVLAKNATTFYQSSQPPAQGLVYEKGSPQPIVPGGTLLAAPPPLVARTMQPFTGDPVASPLGWVDGTETAGNNTVAGTNPDSILCVTGIDTCFIRPITVSAPNRDFSFPLEVGPGAPTPTAFSDAIVVNMFYWTNRAHDLFYAIGFDEAAGNFQTDNHGRGGVGGDAVYGYAQAGILSANRALLNNADFGGFRMGDDGTRPRMRMFVWTIGGTFTDSGLDADVIIHEYAHGVSFRLVEDLYTTFQGGAMGEAWSDFFALEFLAPEGSPANGSFPPGAYVSQNFHNGDRTRPYSADFSVNPLTYANLGHVIAVPEVHADGEIWTQAMVEVRAALIGQFGETEGRRRTRLLAIDSMKLSIPAPSMVDARDAVLLADRTTFNGESQSQIWAAFARRGLGVLAQSANADSVHISPSFETPSDKGVLRFYEDRYTIGETIRIALHDANLTTPSVGLQVLSSAGDFENISLHRRGSSYFGELTSAYAPVFRGDGALSLIPGDFVSAYYRDENSGGGPALVQTSAPTTPDYAISLYLPRPNQYPNETRLGLRTTFGSALRALPFEFPFFGKRYSAVRIYSNGLLTFDLPDFSPCADVSSLRLLTAIAPMWMNLVTNGFMQPNEDIYISESPDRMTIRWVAETAADVSAPGITADPEPVNFSVILFKDGNIEFRYGSGNRGLISGSQLFGCPVSGATVGISSGRESLAQIVTSHDSQSSLEEGITVLFQSPYSPIGGPQMVLESPANGDSAGSLITGKGVVFDSEPGVFIRRVDVLVDGVARVPATLNVARPDYCAGKDTLGCPNVGFTFSVNPALQGIGAGAHTLQLRAVNSRGVILAYPETPVSINVTADAPGGIHAALEGPTDGLEVTGRVPVTGYVGLENARVAGVDIIVDGITYGSATYGMPRADVCGGLPSTVLNCPRIGFTFMLNSEAQNPLGDILLPPGKHTLQLRARDEANRYFLFPENPITITSANPANQPPRVGITVPYRNEVVTGLMSIMGHAYDPDGEIATLRLVVDGLTYNSVTINYGSERPEVCAGLEDVTACPNIGFELGFDTRRLANGPHTLSITATDDKGAITYSHGLTGGLNFFVNNP